MTELKDLKTKTVWSAISLFFQSGYSAILGLVANLVLTIILTPKIFGIYITLLSTIAFLNYFSDIGLAASLIQKKELTESDVKSTFTFQQILIFTLVIIGSLFGPSIQKFYQLPKEGLYLYWTLLISFLISSLKTIPSVFLERNIKFQKIVFVQIVENTVFYVVVTILAILGLGLKSFIFAVLLRAITGLILIYSISPWMPKIGISRQALKQLLSFGVPFQASSFLALFKDDLIILFLAKMVGFDGVAYIGWAKKWAEAPIRIIMDNLTKVFFPLIARIQDNKEKIGQILEKMLYYQTAVLTPMMLMVFFVIPKLVYVIPRYNKWAPALPLFYIFVLSSYLVSFLSPFISLFNALGKAKISFNFMLFWTIITWILTPLFTIFLGLFGFPLTHLIISSTFFLVILKAKQNIPFIFSRPTHKFLLSALPMIIIMTLFNTFPYPNLIFSIIFIFLSGSFMYFFFLTVFFKINLIKDIKYLLNQE